MNADVSIDVTGFSDDADALPTVAAAVEAAKVTPADAIRTAAPARNGAPAVVAGIARSAASSTSEVHAYMVGVLTDRKLESVAVDSNSGLVISTRKR